VGRVCLVRRRRRHQVSWLRSTLGFRKIDGRWRVAHQHVSVPFDMESGQAKLDLKP
jgi:ketosteroid isomerase-like protein